jgi:hypothetical protein
MLRSDPPPESGEANSTNVEDRIARFRNDLLTIPCERIIRRHLTFGGCAMLRDDDYFKLKVSVAEHFEIHPNEVVVVGSAKLGFSIVPKKRYRPFRDSSDIDVAIVSSRLFERIWYELFLYEQSMSAWATRDELASYFMRGWLRPDKLPPSRSFMLTSEWFEFFRKLSGSRQFGYIKIAAGLYHGWTFLEGYQKICVAKCIENEEASR